MNNTKLYEFLSRKFPLATEEEKLDVCVYVTQNYVQFHPEPMPGAVAADESGPPPQGPGGLAD